MKKETNSKNITRTLLTGFVGGFFWGMISLIMYFFNFIEVTPKMYVVKSWIKSDWTNGWIGDLFAIILIGMLSMSISLLYHLLFRKINSIWIGFMYGLVLWMVVFIIVQPLFPNITQLADLKRDTLISTICLFSLYGTFIGYSISYAHYESELLKKE